MKLKELFESAGTSVADLGIEYTDGDLLLYPAELSLYGAKVFTRLTSLKGSPNHITGDFYCNDNEIVTLIGGPSIVDGDFICNRNNLTTLEGSPEKVGASFFCPLNRLTSLKGITKNIGHSLNCSNNLIASLKGVHEHVTGVGSMFDATGNPIKSHVLGLMLIDGLKAIRLDNKQVGEILEKHLGKGRAGMLMAQEELIEAGLEEFAQL